MHGFINFVREQGVMALAIAVVFGGAVGKVVTSFVDDIIQPVIGFVFGSPEGLSKLHYKSLMYGNFISNLIDFLIIALIIYLAFTYLRLNRLDKPKDK